MYFIVPLSWLGGIMVGNYVFSRPLTVVFILNFGLKEFGLGLSLKQFQFYIFIAVDYGFNA